MTAQQNRKQILRKFMADHYSDERLAMLLAHAQEGKLNFHSCCCFIGIPNADHALQSGFSYELGFKHYIKSWDLNGARQAEHDFCGLGNTEQARRRILIPMVCAEIKRRDRARYQKELTTELTERNLIHA
jgi:hypothetical protein